MNAQAHRLERIVARRATRRNAPRGAAAVEFAVTAPILFALVLGAIEISRANMLVHTASIAATEAARRGIIAGATAEDVRLKALSELANVGVVDATVDVDPPQLADDTTQVTVNLIVPVTLRNGYGLSRILLGKQVFKSVTLQCEGKTEDVASEVVQYDGMEIANGTRRSNGNNGNGNSNSGNGNGNSGNGNSGNGNSGNGNSGNGNSGNGNGNSGSSGGSGSSGSGSGNSGSGGSGSGGSGRGGSGSGDSDRGGSGSGDSGRGGSGSGDSDRGDSGSGDSGRGDSGGRSGSGRRNDF